MWRGARRALVVGAAAAAMAVGGARANIRPIGPDGCSRGCGWDATSVADSAQDGVGAKIAMSLIGGGPGSGALPLLFDPEAVPAVLASGFPSALSPRREKDPGAGAGSTYVDFDYVFAHPEEIGGPASFLSVASLTGQLTFAGVLSDSNEYFAAQVDGLTLLQIGPDMGDYPRVGAPYYYFSSADTKEVPMTATPLKYPWMRWMGWSADTTMDALLSPLQ